MKVDFGIDEVRRGEWTVDKVSLSSLSLLTGLKEALFLSFPSLNHLELCQWPLGSTGRVVYLINESKCLEGKKKKKEREEEGIDCFS